MISPQKIATGVLLILAAGVQFLGLGISVYFPILVFLLFKLVLRVQLHQGIELPRWLQVSFLIWIVFLGVSALNRQAPWFAMARDFAWLTSPWFSYAAGILYKAVVGHRDTAREVNVIQWASRVYLTAITVMLALARGNVFTVRDMGYFNTSIPFILISMSLVPGMSFSTPRDMLGWIITLVSMSRLNLISVLPPYLFRKVTLRRVVVSTVVLALLVAVLWKVLPMTEAGRLFVEKFVEILNEVFISDFQDMGDAYKYWRPFELLTGVNSYLGLPLLKQLIGNGLGAQLPLGGEFLLAGSLYSEIPILHNGISFLFLKAGLAGILFTAWFLAKVAKGMSTAQKICFFIYVMLGALSITGPFHPQFSLLFFLVPILQSVKAKPLRPG